MRNPILFLGILLAGGGIALLLHLSGRTPSIRPDPGYRTEISVSRGRVALENRQGAYLELAAGETAVMAADATPETVVLPTPMQSPGAEEGP